MEEGLQKQKQAVVRDAIYDSAIDLFANKGFDETTVEEVAQSAGLSRRTFFRYFKSKDDLLAHAIVNYTRALEQAVQGCPANSSPLEVMTAVVQAAAHFTERADSRTREVIEISMKSAAARQAYSSRMVDVEDSLARVLSEYFKYDAVTDLRPRLLASLTLTMVNTTIAVWYQGKHMDLSKASVNILLYVRSLFNDDRSGAKLHVQSSFLQTLSRKDKAATKRSAPTR